VRWPINDYPGVNALLLLLVLTAVVVFRNMDARDERARWERFDTFMAAGGRFTKEDGDLLRRRVEMLEHRVEILEDIERKEHARKPQ